MNRISKRLLSLVLALMMVATLLPMGAIQVFAEELTWTEVDTFEEFTAAIANDCNIKLTGDITATGKVQLAKNIVIDFNGHTYHCYADAFDSFYITAGHTTMRDSSAEGKGGMSMVGTASRGYQVIRVAGKLTIENGSYSFSQETSTSNSSLIYSWGTITILGGTFTATGAMGDSLRAINNASSGKLTLKGGTFNVTNTGAGAAYGIRIESNKNATITVPADANAVTFTVRAANSSAFGIENKGVLNLYSDKLSISATTDVTGTADKYAYGINNFRTVDISGGSFKAYTTNKDASKTQAMGLNNTRIDSSTVGTGTISGGTFYGSAPGNRGAGIVTAYAKDLIITGDADISGTGRSFYAYRGTTTISGGSFSSEHASYGIEVTKDSNVTITGGTFSVNKEKHIRNAGTLSISGGTFKSILTTISSTGTLTITGGNFVGASGQGMLDIYAHLDTSKYSQNDNGTVVAAGTVAPRFSVTIGDTTTNYESVVSAITAASADTTGNAKLTLLRDITLGLTPATTTTMEIDLGGHTWLNYNGMNMDVGGLGTEKKITKIHNGIVINTGTSVPVAVKKGAMQLENLTVYGCSTMPVCYYAPTGDYTADNYIRNCNLITNRYYVFSYRSESEAGQQDMDMLIENTNLINLYGKTGGGEIFYTGAKASTGKITLGKNVNIYQLADTTNLARQAGQTTAVVQPVAAESCAIHDRVAPQQYGDVNAVLAKIGQITGFQDGAYVYKQESVWNTSPSLYKISTEHTFEDGACACGETTVATIGDTKYQDLATALDAAAESQTVVLNGNVNTQDDLMVANNISLDLNGSELNAGSLTVYGNLIDGNIGGNALVKSDNFHIKGDAFLPVYDSASEGYRFYKYELVELGNKNVSENAIKFGFRLELDNEFGYSLLQDTANNKVTLNATISWTGDHSHTMNYPFKAATLASLAEALLEGKSNYAIALTITGTDLLGENGTVAFAPIFNTGCGLDVNGQGNTWTAGA